MNPKASALPASPAILTAGSDPLSPSRERTGQWLMTVGGMLLGTIGVFVEEAGQHPLVTVWFRCVFGALALVAWCLATGRGRELLLRHQALGRRVACATGVFMVLNWALFFAAIPRTSIAVATVIFHVQPIWVIVFGAVFLRERIAPLQWGATLAALAGLVLTTGLIDGAAAGTADGGAYVAGVLMCLGGSLCYAAVTLLASRAPAPISPFALALWQCLVGAVSLAWAPLAFGGPHSAGAWAWLTGLGVLHTGLAYVILFAGMARLALGKVAVLQFVYPLTAVLVDWAVYGRTLSPVQLGGVALMAVALWTLRRPPVQAAAPASR
ncbi:EamA family transporter [Acidovorax sp. HMWF018]|uniref:DMT family transporter n=1 Tax=Acidovorax sp. HMWF018 TaxID=2056855 RepID=UPI000D3952EB|nr:DMT family transporter [Acidovorax sp. HMWF018]PTT37475.1 EamA family transporter [Acidovorax sp. HMWF018]